ncbi:uncharacterized protein LOC107263622 [Cephus cinctus]|uniref:Uncharacterized protein LOC107263622 n=1 Tax=Cephus cinctus TaxID=211228 RepID=A0AAJ7RAH2_CEPCN|nr:uncharacterized protein LOC107263622 [Cephus cinctus]XP_024936900.1 uncharacterized protein LOC107263622 [Cephus cinctus]
MKRNKMLLLFCTLFSATVAISSQWRPVIPTRLGSSLLHQEAAAYESPLATYSYDEVSLPQSHPLAQQEQDQCALYKVSMSQQLYFEYIHYKTDLPDLQEFTLCMWTKFYNHSNDHPLFSYAVGDQPRGIFSWVANTARSSYYMLNIDGHNLYRLNYPLRLNKWYHSCQSWNGRTGEWQIWVNDERVGRGFNNRLVGHVIKGGGIAISGQEQRQLGGGFLEGHDAPQGSGGFLGELTMVQLYNVALTAGKAHRDHKHHHAHHYEHDTNNNTPRTTTAPPVTGPPLPMNPFLTGGQINHQVKINPGVQVQINQNGVTLRHPNIPPQQEPAPQPFPPPNPDSLAALSTASPPISGIPSYGNSFRTTQFFGNLASPLGRIPQVAQLPQLSQTNPAAANGFSFVNGQYHNLFKRDKSAAQPGDSHQDDLIAAVESTELKKLVKRETVDDKVSFLAKKEPSSLNEKTVSKRDSEKRKRGLVQLADGSVLDDSYLVSQGLDNNYFSGLASFGAQLPAHATKDEEREPAEAEVKQVMDICDGCAEEPFEKALVMSWRNVPKKLYSGAVYLPAAQTCKAF